MTAVALHNQPGDHPTSVRTGDSTLNIVPDMSNSEDAFKWELFGMDVNKRLRGDESIEGLDDLTDRLDSEFSAAEPLTDSIATYRGVTGSSKIFGATAEVGSHVTERGFTASTTDTETAEKFMTGIYSNKAGDVALVRITTPAGGRALRPGRNIMNEVLLPRNTTFQITGERRTNGRREIDMEVT